MKLSKEDKKTIPVWVKFFNVPLEYWDRDGLSRIASAVGVPLFMDQLTSSGSRISFARVCVDIPTTSAFPDSFALTSGDDSVPIHVEYQGVPSQCLHCQVFGHDTKTCLSAQVEKLVELQKNTEEKVESVGGWMKVRDEGKRKVGDHSSPIKNVHVDETSSSATKGNDMIAAFQSEVVEIAKIINPAVEDFIRSIEHVDKVEVRANSPEIQGSKGDSGTNMGSATKNRSSGRTSGGQRMKKR
ncbi:uncharacterized protein LOC114309476 [Camellia sinensis]|uniref:uncharacterized protein LOC114309476 n=1 Tax=Camellia sinensis TaxID=4442 RepID=UPI00103621CB|nr:uncharacterized protein LOC114309476 [Camellia sinensis]